jgi:pyruvate/2-oxoglutarate dehydrogenase complex dihydrolipoamide dehydrogenase (E3) component
MDPIASPRSSSSSHSWSSWSSPPSVLSREQNLRVAVIGAGLSGLALGQLLQNAPNVQVTVYERSLGLDSLSGYRIMISQYVLKRLHASLPKDIWSKITLSIGISPRDGHKLTFMKR